MGSVAAIALGAVACGGGKNAGSAVRPKEITAADALGGGGKGGAGGTCAATDDDRALIIDLADEDRKAIEEMVKVGRVPIVAYDCKSLKLLERCKLQAQFAYTSSGLRDKVISIENSDAAVARRTGSSPRRTKRKAMTTVAKTSKNPSTHRCTTHQRQYSAMARLVWRPHIRPAP